jgi:hypothetical protein
MSSAILQFDTEAPLSFERANIIRDWAYGQIVVCSARCLLDHHQLTLNQMLDLMRSRRFGMWCGGATTFLKLLYQQLGYEAYAVDFGWPTSENSHVLNVVPVASGSKTIMTIQDPYFNFTVTDTVGNAMDYREIITKVCNAEHSQMRITRGPTSFRWIIYADRDDFEENEDADLTRRSVNFEQCENGRFVFKTDMYDPKLFEWNAFYKREQRWLKRCFGRVSLIDYLQVPIGTSGEDAIEKLIFPEKYQDTE